MEEKKFIEDEKTEKVSGGTDEPKRGCELCGQIDEYEYYRITLKFADGSEYLGRKKICMECRNDHCMKYARQNYPGRTIKTVYMEGPLAI